MRRPFLLLVAVAMTAALLARSAAPAAACYITEDYDPIEASAAIAGGRLTGWSLADDIEAPSDPWGLRRIPIRVHMTVDHRYKGDLPDKIDIVELRAVELWQGEYTWSAAVWDCGFFASSMEPPAAGLYVIMGFRGDGEGHLLENWTFFAGEEPAGEAHNGAVDRLKSSDLSSGPPLVPIVVAGVALPLVFLLGAAFVWRAWRAQA